MHTERTDFLNTYIVTYTRIYIYAVSLKWEMQFLKRQTISQKTHMSHVCVCVHLNYTGHWFFITLQYIDTITIYIYIFKLHAAHAQNTCPRYHSLNGGKRCIRPTHAGCENSLIAQYPQICKSGWDFVTWRVYNIYSSPRMCVHTNAPWGFCLARDLHQTITNWWTEVYTRNQYMHTKRIHRAYVFIPSRMWRQFPH